MGSELIHDFFGVREYINDYFTGKEPFDIVLASVLSLFVVWITLKLITNGSQIKDSLITKLFNLAKKTPGLGAKISHTKQEVKERLKKDFIMKGEERYIELPKEGLSSDFILKKMKKWQMHDDAKWSSGQVSGCVYLGDQNHTDLLNAAYGMFSLSNPLHPDVFTTVRKFETEIIQMTLNMLGGNGNVHCGCTTSGGTESILMAVKTYRDQAIANGKKEFEIIVPITAHAAFDKAGQYFNVKVLHAPLKNDFCVDVKAMKNMITKNTILLVGSAPNFPHGMIDPISEIAELARSHKIGFHVDCCLGGFILPFLKRAGVDIPPFDFSVKGVTSISADTHKYGYSSKGTSVLLFNDRELRQHMYFVTTTWPGGVYASPSMPGSRPGGLIAATWASMVSLGVNGYQEKAAGIYKATQAIISAIKSLPELHLIGNPPAMVVAFSSKTLNIFQVNDAMSKRGWHLNTLQNPNSLHICLTAKHADAELKIANKFSVDLRHAVEYVKNNPQGVEGGSAPLYGSLAKLPGVVVGEIASTFVDVLLDEE